MWFSPAGGVSSGRVCYLVLLFFSILSLYPAWHSVSISWVAATDHPLNWTVSHSYLNNQRQVALNHQIILSKIVTLIKYATNGKEALTKSVSKKKNEEFFWKAATVPNLKVLKANLQSYIFKIFTRADPLGLTILSAKWSQF